MVKYHVFTEFKDITEVVVVTFTTSENVAHNYHLGADGLGLSL
jgi:hypothetical protein